MKPKWFVQGDFGNFKVYALSGDTEQNHEEKKIYYKNHIIE